MPLVLKDPLAARIVAFLENIDLPVRLGEVPEPSLLPGITIQAGGLLIDEARLLYPGDLLHEAGHLAVLPPAVRSGVHGDAGDDGGLEMAAIAWSYAAAVHLGLSPSVVFHEAGYRGGAQALIDNFTAGRYIGVPVLEWIGLTAVDGRAKALGVPPYPSMLKWLRDGLDG
jgi:hypothetical protein